MAVKPKKINLKDGQRVRLRDGRIATIADSNYPDSAKLIIDGSDSILYVWRDTGEGNRNKVTQHDVVEIISVDATANDADAPGCTEVPAPVVKPKLTLPLKVGQKVVCKDGRTRTVERLGPGHDGHGDIAYFDGDKSVWAKIGYETANSTEPTSSWDCVSDAGVRQRVRKPKPTVDQNFTELVETLDTTRHGKFTGGWPEGVKRAQWLVKAILRDLTKDTDLPEARKTLLADAVKEAERIIAHAKEVAADKEAMAQSGLDNITRMKAEAESLILARIAELDEKFEGRVKREVQSRIDQMFGKKATMKRKRALKVDA